MLSILTNKYVIFMFVISSIVIFYNLKLIKMDYEIIELTTTNTELFEEARLLNKVNKSNITIIDEYIEDIDILKLNNTLLLSSKEKTIDELTRILKNKMRNTVYTQKIKYKECVINLKEYDENTTDYTFSVISNIGN